MHFWIFYIKKPKAVPSRLTILEVMEKWAVLFCQFDNNENFCDSNMILVLFPV